MDVIEPKTRAEIEPVPEKLTVGWGDVRALQERAKNSEPVAVPALDTPVVREMLPTTEVIEQAVTHSSTETTQIREPNGSNGEDLQQTFQTSSENITDATRAETNEDPGSTLQGIQEQIDELIAVPTTGSDFEQLRSLDANLARLESDQNTQHE